MAEENENLQEAPLDELKRKILEGQAPPQAEEQKPKEEEKEKPPAPVEGQAEETPAEQLILGKFKSDKDVQKGYQELEKKSTKDAQRLSHYKEFMVPYVDFDSEGNVAGLKPEYQATQPISTPGQSQQTPPPSQTQDEMMGLLEQRYNAYETQYGPTKASLMVHAELTNAMLQNSLKSALSPVDEIRASNAVEAQKRKLRGLKPDFGQFETSIDDKLKRMDAKSKLSPIAIETLYNIARGEKYEELKKSIEAEASAKTAEIEQQKVKAQVEHQTKTPEEPEVNIDDLSSSELAKRAGLKKADRYY